MAKSRKNSKKSANKVISVRDIKLKKSPMMGRGNSQIQIYTYPLDKYGFYLYEIYNSKGDNTYLPSVFISRLNSWNKKDFDRYFFDEHGDYSGDRVWMPSLAKAKAAIAAHINNLASL